MQIRSSLFQLVYSIIQSISCGTLRFSFVYNMTSTSITMDREDELWIRLRQEAQDALKEEPELEMLLHRTILAPGVASFEDAVAATVCYRMLLHPCMSGSGSTGGSSVNPATLPPSLMFCPNTMRKIISDALQSDELEGGHTMSTAVREDASAVCRRDPACDTLLEVVLFYKGFAALVCHRAARRKWKQPAGSSNPNKRSFTALFLQSQASAVFGVDIHPAATIGAGILLDHGTGIVIGETAFIGDGCTLLHGVTLGGTGKPGGERDRHPKVGKHVLIGAGASILGNIIIGDGAKIGAGSIVLRPIPAGATAVGAPAKIIGRAMETNPGSDMDDTLEHVNFLHKSESMSNTTVTTTTSGSSWGELSEEENVDFAADESKTTGRDCFCPFREYKKLAKQAPKGSITIKCISRLLSPAGCTEDEVGQVFFALDSKNVGHVHREEFMMKCTEVITTFTSLGTKRVEELVADFYQRCAASTVLAS
jgi:serine O-acetyltransferase